MDPDFSGLDLDFLPLRIRTQKKKADPDPDPGKKTWIRNTGYSNLILVYTVFPLPEAEKELVWIPVLVIVQPATETRQCNYFSFLSRTYSV